MKTEIKTTTLKKEMARIKPFRNVRIGDPLYFEEMAAGSENKNLKTLTVDTKTRCCTAGACVISLDHNTNDSFEWDDIQVDVYLAADEQQLATYLAGRWYGEKTVRERHQLGCDTARFEMEIDGRYDLFHTGADGFFGEAVKYKQYFGFSISLSFDPDFFSYDEIKERMEYLFNIKDPWINNL